MLKPLPEKNHQKLGKTNKMKRRKTHNHQTLPPLIKKKYNPKLITCKMRTLFYQPLLNYNHNFTSIVFSNGQPKVKLYLSPTKRPEKCTPTASCLVST